MMTFNDFFQIYSLEIKTTSEVKIYQILSSLGLSDVVLYLRDGPFSTDIEVVNLHPSKGTHWLYTKPKIILIITVVLLLKNYLRLL